jgi:hypothetical protein
MSKIALTPNATGTGVFTISSPATNTNRTLTLPDEAGSIVVNTATGIDVTGTVTADGLTVESATGAEVRLKNTDSDGASGEYVGKLHFEGSDSSSGASGVRAGIYAQYGSSFGYTSLDLLTSISGGSLKRAMNISGDGDISFYEDTGTTAKFFWDASAESLGIGTSSPTTKLQSKGGSISNPTDNAGLIANASASFVVNHGNDYGLYTGYVASANDAIGIAATRTLGSALPLSLQPFGGNVGIGMSSPANILALRASAPTIDFITTAGNDTSASIEGSVDVGTGGKLVFITKRNGDTPVERMRIDSSGNVGIGVVPDAWRTAFPDKALDLGSHSALYDQFGSSTFLANNFYRSNDNTFKYKITAGATAISLDAGELSFFNAPSGTAGTTATLTNRMTLNSSGGLILVGSTAQKATGTTWSNPSDQRLKTDIRDYTKGSAELMQVRVREWLYNGKGGTVDGMAGLGVIADEVMTVLPDTVETYEAFLEKTDELPTAIKKFDATEITWLLVTSLQEALTEISALKVRVAALEAV